jgi:uncharacterized protein YaaN involved in tellurite resistance
MKNTPESNSKYPMILPDSLAGEIIQVGEATAPAGLSGEDILVLKEQVKSLVNELDTAAGSQEMIIMDNLTNLGMQTQRAAGGQLELLRGQIGDMMLHRDISTGIAKDLVDLRLTLNEINPQLVSRQDILHRVFYSLPVLNSVPFARRVLAMIAIRYETVSRQVQVIESRLGEGRRLLVRDNVELRKLYEQIENQMVPVQKNAFFGELIMQELNNRLDGSVDLVKRAHLQSALYDVVMRVQDLRTMEEVFNQYFISIDLTRQNNNRLAQAVDRTLTLATNIVVIGLAIQTALSRQKRILEATQKTREFLGNMIADNASAIRQHTQEIGDVYNNPAIALDKIIEAHDQLTEALKLVDQLEKKGSESAQQNILRLTKLSADLQQKALALHVPSERPDLEAKQIKSKVGAI